MGDPVYKARIVKNGAPYSVQLEALELMPGKWAIGYRTPNGLKKLKVRGNVRMLESKETCIDRLRQFAFYNGWKENKER